MARTKINETHEDRRRRRSFAVLVSFMGHATRSNSSALQVRFGDLTKRLHSQPNLSIGEEKPKLD